ncbi:hypothetical protein BGW80DRAFT_1464225 [Lactifluus volemus]|nr:hypothetical protein BGW80DRAFT_1464225 [Lactifluus volemus]
MRPTRTEAQQRLGSLPEVTAPRKQRPTLDLKCLKYPDGTCASRASASAAAGDCTDYRTLGPDLASRHDGSSASVWSSYYHNHDSDVLAEVPRCSISRQHIIMTRTTIVAALAQAAGTRSFKHTAHGDTPDRLTLAQTSNHFSTPLTIMLFFIFLTALLVPLASLAVPIKVLTDGNSNHPDHIKNTKDARFVWFVDPNMLTVPPPTDPAPPLDPGEDTGGARGQYNKLGVAIATVAPIP